MSRGTTKPGNRDVERAGLVGRRLIAMTEQCIRHESKHSPKRFANFVCMDPMQVAFSSKIGAFRAFSSLGIKATDHPDFAAYFAEATKAKKAATDPSVPMAV